MADEQEHPAEVDDFEPSDKPDPIVVGIGASAGGLAVLRTLFSHVAADSGLAYVVVVHLSPEHESHLPDLLQPHVRIPVQQVTETVLLEPNRVYVIPPNANLNSIDTHLRLSNLEESRRERAPIDHFFRTLAQTHDGHAIGVILTGTGSDGTLGIKEIKEKGGLTVVQDPQEAEYDGMPQSAIATGIVDLILPVAHIPGAVLRFARTQPRINVAKDGETLEAEHRALLQKILAQVRARTGRDFSRYKRSTIMRRVQRRMQLRHVEELDRYLGMLREQADEVRALAEDLLITVTSFFRDTEVFEKLQTEIIRELVERKSDNDELRVWSVGCATGEEVYSIAILLLEEVAKLERGAPKIQLFASDLHERSLAMAREGFYPGDIDTDVSAERLKRFFVAENGGYRVKNELREMVVFAPHNLLGDPPFSRLDLIVCRNLLIYLQRDVQRDIIQIFHYALRPDGYLMLGTSETVDDSELFRTVDKGHAIYRRRNVQGPELRLPVFPILRGARAEDGSHGEQLHEPIDYGRLHQRMVERYAPPSMLVTPDDKIVHLSQHAGRYLVLPGGAITSSAVKLVREELRIELTAALHSSREQRQPARTKPIPLRFNGEIRFVTIDVRPALEPQQEGYSLIIFDERDEAPRTMEAAPAMQPEGERAEVRELRTELDLMRQRLQTIIEEFETSQEEMKAANEELQSTNEELRSTMEELETSKEELQSTNEELQTVNQENRHKVEELAQLSTDLQNLLAATEIATLFLDRELRILRFTPKVSDLFNVRVTDRGRPISDLTHRLGYPELGSDAEEVLRRLVPVEREVQDETGCWYLGRILPYRSSDDRIAGVVITFIDITTRKNAERELREMNETLEERVESRTRQARVLAASLTRAEQRERRRLSQVLHDDLQQMLYGVQLKLRLAREALGNSGGEAARQIEGAEELLARSTTMTRQLSVDLNPPILQSEGMHAVVGWLQTQMRELHDLDVRIGATGDLAVPDGDVRVLLFQMVRELLFNVAKHSGSRVAYVELARPEGEIVVTVRDEGRGFDPSLSRESGEESFGLASVRERLDLLGGRMEIHSRPGLGARVVLHVPLPSGLLH